MKTSIYDVVFILTCSICFCYGCKSNKFQHESINTQNQLTDTNRNQFVPSTIPEYAFKIPAGFIHNNDEWFIHTSTNPACSCFILTVFRGDNNTIEHWKGGVPCPDVCGIQASGILSNNLKNFLDNHPLQMIDEVNDHVIDYYNEGTQQIGVIYTIPIAWKKTINFLSKNPALYFYAIVCDPAHCANPNNSIRLVAISALNANLAEFICPLESPYYCRKTAANVCHLDY